MNVQFDGNGVRALKPCLILLRLFSDTAKLHACSDNLFHF